MRYSVIIPAYHCENTLKNTVESIQNCGITNYEIVIVNDGSTDQTQMVCEQLARDYSFISCFPQDNKGVSAARNKGLQKACGEYIWFVDADDDIEPGSFIKLDALIQEHHPDILMFGLSMDYYFHNRLYKTETLHYSKDCLLPQDNLKRHYIELFKCNAITPVWNKLIKKSLIDRSGIVFQESMFVFEDLLFSISCLNSAGSVYVCSDVVYHYKMIDNFKAHDRIKRIEDIRLFMVPFNEALKKYPEVLSLLYYMVLRQKVYVSNLSELKKIAETLNNISYSPQSVSDFVLQDDLLNERFSKILRKTRYSKIRHRLAVLVKSSAFYRLIKG